jgi:arylsulfatase A-like enzyme
VVDAASQGHGYTVRLHHEEVRRLVSGPFASKGEARQWVWDALQRQGLARLPIPPHARIPNFAGADAAAERLFREPPWRDAASLKVDSDSPQRDMPPVDAIVTGCAAVTAGRHPLDPAGCCTLRGHAGARRAAATGLTIVRALRCLLLIPALLLPAAVSAADQGAPAVVLLSWDGVRHDFPDRAELPGLARMAADGVRAGRLIPVYPSNTFPTHVSIATGTYPDRHGIVDNRFVDRSRPCGEDAFDKSADADWIEAEPLWIAAERQGVVAAVYFWPGSETDWRGQRAAYREAPFDSRRPEAQKVDRILEWLALPSDRRPRLIMSYWAGSDRAGHDRGPDHPAVIEALRAQDAQLQRLLAGIDELALWPVTTLIVLSDHGMTRAGGLLDVSGALARAGIEARVTGGAVAQIHLDDSDQRAAAAAALSHLAPLEVYERGGVPADWRLAHPQRSGDLTVAAPVPYLLSWPGGAAGWLRSAATRLGFEFGAHGHHPGHPDMAGIFLALGRGVRRDLVLPEVQQIDVAASVAVLLDMDPPRDSEGRPVPGIGERWMTRLRPGQGSRLTP